jgi:2'-5' RNA ligase
VASSRRRLSVALLIDPPVADAVDGLRGALGDPSLGRIPPHVTLVPPVNVREDELGTALHLLRAAAAGPAGPLDLTLGPPATFLPVNPVLYLEIGGDLNALRMVRDRVFDGPLARPLSWPWVPHLTLAETTDPARIEAALVALDRFATAVSVPRIVLLQEAGRRSWAPLADADFGPPAVVGRGGLALDISRGRMFDPEVRAMIRDARVVSGDDDEPSRPPDRPPTFPIVLSARREGAVVGVAAGWLADDGGQVGVLVSPSARRQGVGGTILAHLETAIRRTSWDCPVLHAHGPAGFYRARSGWSEPVGTTRTPPRRSGPAS